MKTTKLYQSDTYLKEWDASVTSVEKIDNADDRFIITLDRTAFFPEGGGQSCDIGHIDDLDVIDVQESEDGQQVLHTVAGAAGSGIATGDTVHCSIDWERRFDNMQRHCGEHILSGVFYSLFGGVNRGFHMGHEYMTIDISLEEDPKKKDITWEDALAAQLEAHKVIWSDAPVTVIRFDSRDKAEKMPLRKALAFDEDISIVCVGSVENAADCVACCGTHPSTAGQVGAIKIFKVEKYKGMFRIYFEAGQRALADYNVKHDILTALSNRYSSSIEDFPEKLKAQEKKLSAVKDELFHLKKAYIENEIDKLDEMIGRSTEEDGGSSKVIVYPLPHLSMDDAFTMGKHYMEKTDRLIMLYSEKDTSYILVSGGIPDCGSLVKEYASFYNGKGGGNKVSARAIFSDQKDAQLFAELIEKHLR